MDPLEHFEPTNASGDGVSMHFSQVDIPPYARAWGESVRRPTELPKLWDVTIDRHVIFEMDFRSAISTQTTTKYIVPKKCVNCKESKRTCSRTRPTCTSCQNLREQCRTDDTLWDSLPSLRIPKSSSKHTSSNTTELPSADNGHEPQTLLVEATFTTARVDLTAPSPPFRPDIISSEGEQSLRGNQISKDEFSASNYDTSSTPSPSRPISLSSPSLDNIVIITDELEYPQDKDGGPSTEQLIVPNDIYVSDHFSLPQPEETSLNKGVYQTEVCSQPHEYQDLRREGLAGMVFVASTLCTAGATSQVVSSDVNNQENTAPVFSQVDSSMSDGVGSQLSSPNQESEASLTIPFPMQKSSSGKKRGQPKKAKSKPPSLANKSGKASKLGSQSKEKRASPKSASSKILEPASQPVEAISVPSAVFCKKMDLRWTFVKNSHGSRSSNSDADLPAAQEQAPAELRPRVWTGSRKDLLTIFPEFSKSPTGLAWLYSETPMLLLENSVFGSAWDEDININLSMTWDFSCDESDLEPIAQNIPPNQPPVSDFMVHRDEEDETITSLGSLEYPPGDALPASDEAQNGNRMQEPFEDPTGDISGGISLGDNPDMYCLTRGMFSFSSIAETSFGSSEDFARTKASSEHVYHTILDQPVGNSQDMQSASPAVNPLPKHPDACGPDPNPSSCETQQPSTNDAVSQLDTCVLDVNAFHGYDVVLDAYQSVIPSQFPVGHAFSFTAGHSGSCFTEQNHIAKIGANSPSEPSIEQMGSSHVSKKSTSLRLPEKKPPEIEVLIRLQSLEMPLVVIASRTCALMPASLHSQYAYSYLGFFFVSNVRLESLEFSSDQSLTGINGRVTWSLTLDWAPGGEELLIGSDAPLPWWISPASPDGKLPNKGPSHHRDLSGQYSSYLPLDLLAPSTPSEPFPRGWFCKECGMVNEQRFFRHKICGNSTCKSVASDQSTIGYVENLYTIRETQQNLPMLIPFNSAPECVEIIVTKWMDGMDVYRYGINENIAIKHISTCNYEDLQEEPTRLLEYIQAHVPLLREDSSSPYFIHMATKSRVDNTRAVSWEDIPVLLHARDLIQHYVQVYDEDESFSIDSLLTQAWVRSGSRKGKVFRAKTFSIVLFCLGSDVDLRFVPKTGFWAEAAPEISSAMEGVVSSQEPFHEADQRIGMFHNGIGNDSGQGEPTYERPPPSLIDRETLAQDTAMETANGDGTEPVAAISSHKDLLVTSGQNAGQDELPLAGRRKGQLKQQTDLAITLVHGDALILQGDDFECQIKRTGTTILLIGTQAAAAGSGDDVSCDGPELGQSIPNYSWNPLEISRVSEDVEIEEPPDVTDRLMALFGM